MPVAQRAKNKEFNLHTAFFSFPHPSPSGSFHFSSPHLSLSGSEFSLEIRELEQDTLCLSVRLSDYTLQRSAPSICPPAQVCVMSLSRSHLSELPQCVCVCLWRCSVSELVNLCCWAVILSQIPSRDTDTHTHTFLVSSLSVIFNLQLRGNSSVCNVRSDYTNVLRAKRTDVHSLRNKHPRIRVLEKLWMPLSITALVTVE